MRCSETLSRTRFSSGTPGCARIDRKFAIPYRTRDLRSSPPAAWFYPHQHGQACNRPGGSATGIAKPSAVSYNVRKWGLIMNLGDYFENTEGSRGPATADAEGRVDAAVYSRPHVVDKRPWPSSWPRSDHHNLKANPAVYLFRESRPDTSASFYLTKLREERDSPAIEQLRQKNTAWARRTAHRFLVFFRVDKVLPLTGSEPRLNRRSTEPAPGRRLNRPPSRSGLQSRPGPRCP